MKILFTGASSFTGYWFIKELVQNGHDVTALFRNLKDHYQGTRKTRVDLLQPQINSLFECSFGDDKFLRLLDSENWDVLCHHAADVTDYKSPHFNYLKAIENNTHNIQDIIKRLKDKGIRLVLTGSVFEQNEGKGSDNLRAVSPYGLSKGLTSEIFKYHCAVHHVPLSKFVIPNPFGPYEEIRYTTFLIEQWFAHKNAPVKFPDYVRDNIPVSLLAKAYADSISVQNTRYHQFNPSGYVGSQAVFTEKFAQQMRKRLSLPCEYTLLKQTDFAEPLERVNTQPVDIKKMGWDEHKAWDELAEYYQSVRTTPFANGV